MTTIRLPEEASRALASLVTPSSYHQLEQALRDLSAHKQEWADLPIPARIALLDQIVADMAAEEDAWVAAAMAAKGARPETVGEGEEWFNLTVCYRTIRYLRQTLDAIHTHGTPPLTGKASTRANGQVVVQVVPADWKESLALIGIRAEVWMEPDVRLDSDGQVPMAAFYRSEQREGRVCAILGAGNAAATNPGDFMHKLFVEGQVVAIKMNPVNEYLGPILERAYRALIEAGYLRILYGGAAVGAALFDHPLVDTLHMTGSDKTYEAIVFGSGEAGQRRKRERDPLVTKPFSAELGNISPVIVVPGPWQERDIHTQAVRLGSWLVPNAACNCLTPRMIVQMEGWEHRQALNDGIAAFLDGMATRPAYYPGSMETHAAFIDAHPHALQLGDPPSGHLPWTFIQDVDPRNPADICFTREPFLSLYSETALAAVDPVDFITKAVTFANQQLWGTLSASIVVHPDSMQDPAIAAAVEQAIADLHYGSVVINHWGALAYYMTLTPWGGAPGSDRYDIQSGTGFVNNPLMFDRVQKSVVVADFAPPVDPYLAHLRNSYLYYRQDTRFQKEPTVANLVKLLWRAVTVR